MSQPDLSFGGTTSLNTWSKPTLVETNVYLDRIELIYRQESLMGNNWGYLPSRVYKRIYSCIDGVWNESEMIIGKIIPAQPETYEF